MLKETSKTSHLPLSSLPASLGKQALQTPKQFQVPLPRMSRQEDLVVIAVWDGYRRALSAEEEGFEGGAAIACNGSEGQTKVEAPLVEERKERPVKRFSIAQRGRL